MKAAFVTEPYRVKVLEIEEPKIGPTDVLIQVVTAGVCGSDLHLYRGTHAFRKPPAILGHEVAGHVVEVGSEVKSVQIGDRVTVEPQVGCMNCSFCLKGDTNHCMQKTVPGTEKWLGTFCEYFVAPESVVYKIGHDVSYQMGTMIEPLAVAVHAMDMIDVPVKQSILILGAGTIGLLCLKIAQLQGYQQIIVTDTAHYNRAIAEKLGAVAFDPLSVDVPSKVNELTDGVGVDTAVIAAGAANIMDQASASVKKQGMICILAMITEKIPVYTYSMVFKEQKTTGSMTYSTPHFRKAVQMINDGLDLNDFITHEIDIENVQTALSLLSEKKEDVIKVLVRF